MSVLRFNEEQHPEIVKKRLSGDMLLEFAKILREDPPPMKMDSPAALQAPIGQEALNVKKRVGAAVSKELDSDLALAAGLDMAGVENLIKKEVQREISTDDIADAHLAIADEESKNPANETAFDKAEREKHLESLVAAQILYSFSRCLAVQEKHEDELLAEADRLHGQAMPQVKATIEHARSLDSEDEAAQIAGNVISTIGTNTAINIEEYNILARRRSPIAALTGKIAMGRKHPHVKDGGVVGFFDETIADILEVDLKTRAGKQNVAQQRDIVLNELRGQMGIEKTRGMDL